MNYFLNDPAFDFLSNFLSVNNSAYPPYNVYLEGDEEKEYTVEVAVSGFSEKELDVEFNKRTLIISGKKPEDSSEALITKRYIYQGLARRSFSRRFEVKGNLEVTSVTLTYGVLIIKLKDNSGIYKVPIQVTGQEPASQLNFDKKVKELENNA